MRLSTIIAGSVLLATLPAHAQSTRYVTDSLKLEARSGAGTSHRIVRMLESGTRLRVLESGNGWSRVTLPDGADAWILTRYLMDEPPARDRLSAATGGLQAAKGQVAKAEQQTQTLHAENQTLTKSRDELANKAAALTSELSDLKRTASAAIKLRDENRSLKQRTTALEERYKILERDHITLRNARSRDWFIAGAGVLLGGIILGLIIPKLRFKRRRSWGEL